MPFERGASLCCLFLLSGQAFGLEEEPCRLEVDSVPAALAQCSTLTVVEDPANPQGRTIELFVARVPALAATASPDPLVLLAGGPGQSAVDLYLQTRRAFEPVRRTRDIVLMDQRGTGRSADGFECPTPEGTDFQTADAALLESLVAKCLAGLERDPRFFTTSVAVGDLEQLRRALGVAAWNLYGVSYGTRVAQQYLRRYATHVRAAVLDGVVPTNIVLGPEIAQNAQEALDGILARCGSDPDCAQRFGDLDTKFRQVKNRLAGQHPVVERIDPVTGEVSAVSVTEQHLLTVTRLMSYSATTAALLPLAIDEAYRGRYDHLLKQAELLSRSTDRSASFAMHNSVACSEDVPFVERNQAVTFGAGTYLGGSVMDALLSICASWPIGIVDDGFRHPLHTDTPVLLMSGGVDPATPAQYAERAIADGLQRSLHVIAPQQGHGIAQVGCAPTLIRDFIEAGHVEGLDGSCLGSAIAMPFFLSLAGPAP
jgi:pimeloyl-ACP methyl ester carboxylesterase